MPNPWSLAPFFLAGAALYSSVGHGGATVYLAILVLAGYATPAVATTVLVLNIVAAGLAFLQFRHAGHLRPRLLAPFLVTSIPAAFVGGRVPLREPAADAVLGLALLAAALRFLLVPAHVSAPRALATRTLLVIALPMGALLGFLAGATGIGGGIFLSPVLVLAGWATLREAGAVAGAFIVLNSVAGLAARIGAHPVDVELLAPAALAVLVGALVGSWLGARRLPPRGLQLLLGLVLLVAVARIALDHWSPGQ